MQQRHEPLLSALRLNAWFSAVSAVALFAGAGCVATQLGLGSPVPVYAVAACLVLFATQLANIVRTGLIRTWEIAAIIGGDLLWVAATIVLAAIFHSSLTTIGLIMVDAVAVAVLVFAVLQIRGLRYFQQLT